MSRKRPHREPTEEEMSVVVAVRHCAREMDDMLQGARLQAGKNQELFVQTNISMFQRAVKTYTIMLDRLGVQTREEIEKKMGQLSRCEDIQDAEDDLLETEGVWKNLLSNMQAELKLNPTNSGAVSLKEGQKVDWSGVTDLVDAKHSRPTSLQELAKKHLSLLVLCQPAYLPEVAAKWYLDQITKIQNDLDSFRVGVVIVTWGCRDHGKRWAKAFKDSTVPVLLDKKETFVSKFNFKWGLVEIWGPMTIQFYAEMSSAERYVSLPPLDVVWSECLHIGGALLLSASGRVLCLHQSSHPGDMPTPAAIVKRALAAYAKSLGQTEEDILRSRREANRLKIPPDMARCQLEPSSGMYYDPETRLYYDTRSRYYYDGDSGQYVYWDSTQGSYVSANHMYAQGTAHLSAVLQSVQDMACYANPTDEATSYSAVESVSSKQTAPSYPDEDLKPPGT